jgi:hypothetical protein
MVAEGLLRGEGNSGFLYSGIDEIPVSHLTKMEKSWEVNLICQTIF